MKKIAFVLYANQPLGITYLWTFPAFKQAKLEKKIHEAFDEDYNLTFQWEAAKQSGIAALIIPDPFPPTILNEEKISEIHVPANLFYEMKVDEIKEIVDKFFV